VVYLPDSWLAEAIELISARENMLSIPVSREEEGIALGCGLALGGRRPVVLMQNAGLLSAGNVIETLVISYSIPLLMCVAYRGNHADPSFYQVPKGVVTEPALRAFRVPYALASSRGMKAQVADALAYAEAARGPYALLLSKEHLD
jgi:sulfopyruvate decarboxylase TPP-binding subunit